MARFQVGDTVYLRQGLEKAEPRAFRVTETLTERGVDYVRVDHPTCPEGAWEEKFFDLTPSADAGRSEALVPAEPEPAPVDAGPSEKLYVELDMLLTAAVASWVAKDDAGAVDLVTKAIERLRTLRETAGARKQ